MRTVKVSLVRRNGYGPDEVHSSVIELLAPLGGMTAFVKPNDRVVLKPNIIMGRAPEHAVTTHPDLVAAVARLALDCGAKVAVGDSPGIGTLRRAGDKAGIGDVVRRLGLEWVDFTPREVSFENGTFRKVELARELLEADCVINLPKLKNHCMMLLTAAVKNMFGAVLGLQKFQWHLRAGRDKDFFGRALYEICKAVGPALTVVDAVVSMDGDGPTAGKPNPTGFLAAGVDPSAVDAVLMDIVGWARRDLWTLRAAAEAGDLGWESAETVGAAPTDLRPERWTAPASQSAALPLPPIFMRIPYFQGWLRNQTTARPHCDSEACTRCGECAAICPAQVMTVVDSGVAIDHDRCILCYCCHENCRQKAISLRKGFLGRLFSSSGS